MVQAQSIPVILYKKSFSFMEPSWKDLITWVLYRECIQGQGWACRRGAPCSSSPPPLKTCFFLALSSGNRWSILFWQESSHTLDIFVSRPVYTAHPYTWSVFLSWNLVSEENFWGGIFCRNWLLEFREGQHSLNLGSQESYFHLHVAPEEKKSTPFFKASTVT